MKTGLPVGKSLIKYLAIIGGKWRRRREGANWYWITKQNAGPEIMKMVLTLNDLVYNKMTRKHCLDKLHWKLQKQADEEFFSKK